jgi:hypothetical protein
MPIRRDSSRIRILIVSNFKLGYYFYLESKITNFSLLSGRCVLENIFVNLKSLNQTKIFHKKLKKMGRCMWVIITYTLSLKCRLFPVLQTKRNVTSALRHCSEFAGKPTEVRLDGFYVHWAPSLVTGGVSYTCRMSRNRMSIA